MSGSIEPMSVMRIGRRPRRRILGTHVAPVRDGARHPPVGNYGWASTRSEDAKPNHNPHARDQGGRGLGDPMPTSITVRRYQRTSGGIFPDATGSLRPHPHERVTRACPSRDALAKEASRCATAPQTTIVGRLESRGSFSPPFVRSLAFLRTGHTVYSVQDPREA